MIKWISMVLMVLFINTGTLSLLEKNTACELDGSTTLATNISSSGIFADTGTNTTLNILNVPERVDFGNSFFVTGEFFLDRNGDGIFNGDDNYLENCPINVTWQYGSIQEYRTTITTSTPLNGGSGKWNVSLLANAPEIDLNGNPLDPDPGVALFLEYPGIWSSNGVDFHCMTENQSHILTGQVFGVDDDGDAFDRQTNGKDDDGDGTIDDGRPEIPAVGDPEDAVNLTNGIDDDADGTVDDGSPPIPKIGNPEGYDEELLNGLDDDGDGSTDEDVNAFIVTYASYDQVNIEIWHDTRLTIATSVPNTFVVGDMVQIRGAIEDRSNDLTIMGAKTIRLYLDGILMHETVAVPSMFFYHSEYEIAFHIPLSSKAGIHTLTVGFDPSYNTTNNYFFNPSSTEFEIRVRRPVSILFDDLDGPSIRNVYRSDIIYINGTVVDQILLEEYGIIQGPKMDISGINYRGNYSVSVAWGYDQPIPSKRTWYDVDLDENGNFSIAYNVTDVQLSFGDIFIHAQTNFDQDIYLYPFMYYTNAENMTTYRVRADSRIKIWLDQNDNGMDDIYDLDYGDDPIDSFITRVHYDPMNDETSWDTARIRGRVILDDASTGYDQERLTAGDVDLYWQFGMPDQETYDLNIDANGCFELDRKMNVSDRLGPVRLHIVFRSNIDHVDNAVYASYSGAPFSVITTSTLALYKIDEEICGKLIDEKGIGISNRTIDIYGFEISISGRPDPVDIFDHGTLIASVNTDENGTCSLPNWQDNISRSILSIVAVFNGSKEFPNGSSGFRYLPDDAYLPSYSHALSMFRKRETRIDLIDPPKRIQKGDGIVVEGYLVDDFLGTGINDREIVIYIHWSREYYIIGRPMTGNDKEGIGFFHLSTSTFPSGIEYGNAELIICFDPLNGNNEDGSHLYCESITGLQIWLETEIKNRFIGAMDVDVPPDGRIDIYEDEIRDIEFIFQVSGRDAAKIEAVTYGLVYFNITLGPYTNSTRALTDIRGKISFNFSYHGELKDSKTGELFRIPEDGNDTMVISLYFIGKKFFCPCSKEILCQFHESIKITSYDNDEEAEKGGSGIAFMVSSAMAVITMIIVAVVIIIRRSKREEHEE